MKFIPSIRLFCLGGGEGGHFALETANVKGRGNWGPKKSSVYLVLKVYGFMFRIQCVAGV